jgi:hypothetical protein
LETTLRGGNVTKNNEREAGEHVEPLFAAFGVEKSKRTGSLRWKLVWVVIGFVALSLLVWKQSF